MLRLARIACVVVVTLILAAAAAPARAGIADSPLPMLGGVRAKHVFSVPGVITLGLFQTVFVCTSLEKDKEIRLGVELFDEDGGIPKNDVEAGEGALDVGAGDTVILATGNTGAFAEDLIIDFSGVIRVGSARIVATSTKIMCSALLVDPTSAPPVSMAPLTVISKAKQKGS